MYFKKENNYTLTGFLGGDLELNYTQASNIPVLNVSLPLSNGKDKETVWINFTFWNERAKSLYESNYFKKGSLVTIVGVINPDNFVKVYEGKNGPGVNINFEGHDMYLAVKYVAQDTQQNSNNNQPSTPTDESNFPW